MNEQELFRKTFAKIHASEDVEKEILAMKERKKFNPLRPIAAVAVCACLLVGSAFAADAATGGEFFKRIQTVFGEQEIHTVTVDNGGIVGVSYSWSEFSGDLDLPEGAAGWVALGTEAGAYLTQEGRVMLREAGADERDVTEEWAQGGTFTAGDVTFTVEAMSDESGNMAYHCVVDRTQIDWDEAALIGGGLLFDPDRCDLTEIFQQLDMADMAEFSEEDEGITISLEDLDIQEDGSFGVYSFSTGTLPEVEE